jgi:hypothetical protein
MFFSGMLDSATYIKMFDELYENAIQTGPFNRTWSNVPVVLDHTLQVKTIFRNFIDQV